MSEMSRSRNQVMAEKRSAYLLEALSLIDSGGRVMEAVRVLIDSGHSQEARLMLDLFLSSVDQRRLSMMRAHAEVPAQQEAS